MFKVSRLLCACVRERARFAFPKHCFNFITLPNHREIRCVTQRLAFSPQDASPSLQTSPSASPNEYMQILFMASPPHRRVLNTLLMFPLYINCLAGEQFPSFCSGETGGGFASAKNAFMVSLLRGQ